MSLNTNLKNHKCRTCYNATKGLKSLKKMASDEKQTAKSYAEILKEIANINIMKDTSDKLTQSICGGCCRKLKAAHAFVQQAQEVNKKLLAMLVANNESKQTDGLQESRVDLISCLEIKMENEDVEGGGGGGGAVASMNEVKQCEVELKLEDSEEGILPKKSNANILDNKEDEEAIDINTLKTLNDANTLEPATDICDEEAIEDIFSKPDTDTSDYEDNDEDPFSEDSDWQEEQKSNRKKLDKKKSNYKADKSDIDNSALQDDDIAVPCNQCQKIFKNSKALALHLSISHIPEDQKCSCPQCGKKFTRPGSMYTHMRTFHGPETVPLIRKPSTAERPFKCDKCSRTYIKKKHLNVHVRNKHSNENENEIKDDKPVNESSGDIKKIKQPSLCSICGRSFTTKVFLLAHMRRHTGERPFKCDLCDRAFILNAELKVHRRLHTGEKPFECKLCGKAFRVSGKLANHMRSHTDIRPYKCTQCERSFKYSKDLNIHFRIHTGERPYCCNVCGVTFTQSNSLKAHRMKTGHMDAVA